MNFFNIIRYPLILLKDTHRETSPLKNIQRYRESMNTGIFKVCV